MVLETSALLPLTHNGCQCVDECKICKSYYSLIDCGVTWQTTEICSVNSETCADYQYGHNGKIADKCGSWADSAKDLYYKMKSWFRDTAKNIKHLDDKVLDWAKEYIQAIDIDDLLANSPDTMAKLANVWDKFDTTQLEKLKGVSSDAWDKIVKNIPADRLAALSSNIQSKLNPDQREKIIRSVSNIKLADVAAWTGEQWKRVPIDNMVSMSWAVLQRVPVAEMGKWTKEQWNKIPVDKLVKLTGEQIAKIDAQALAAFGDKYWDKVPVYQIVYFGSGLLQSAGVLESMNATHIAFVSAEQWKNVPVESITKFSVEKLQAIDYNALGGWSKEMWDKVPIDTVASFIGKQIEAIPPNTVGNWTQTMWLKFDASQAVMFTGKQLAAGANVLKDMSEDQLAKYDWEQLSEDALAKLPQKLQDKIEKLRTHDTKFSKKKYKELVSRFTTARTAKNEKLKALQITNADPTATDDAKEKARTELNDSMDTEKDLSLEVDARNKEIDAILTTPRVGSPGSRSTLTTSGLAVLLGALFMQMAAHA